MTGARTTRRALAALAGTAALLTAGCGSGGDADAGAGGAGGPRPAGAACGKHSDCQAGLACAFAGLPAGAVWPARVCKAARSLTPAVGQALNALPAGAYLLAPGTYPYLSVSAAVEVYGPEAGEAVIAGVDQGAAAQVTARGKLLLASLTLRRGAQGLVCGGATAALYDVKLNAMSERGLAASDCELSVAASHFTGNQGPALYLAAGVRPALIDSRIADNHALAGAALVFAAGPPQDATLRGLCIANNRNAQGAGGVTCGDDASVVLEDVALVGNSQGPGQRQFYGRCVFKGSPPACP